MNVRSRRVLLLLAAGALAACNNGVDLNSVPGGDQTGSCNTVNMGCNTSGDCCGVLTCNSNKVCSDGLGQGAGTPCTSSTQCSGTLTCDGGVCTGANGCNDKGAACSTSSQCCGSLTCTGGSCSDGSCNGQGARCTSSSQCCGTLTCGSGGFCG